MTRKLSGPPLVAYLRQFPSSDDRGWAADEIERLLAERDALRGVLEKYADLNNWEKDEFGWRRIWREPGSTTPESYDGSELAFAALAQGAV